MPAALSSPPFVPTTTAKATRCSSQRFTRLSARVVLMEVGEGCEGAVAYALQAGGIPIAVIDARRTRDFVRAMDAPAKTDWIDAAMPAEYAAVLVADTELERRLMAPSDLKASCERLIAESKPAKVVLSTRVRKSPTPLNATVRTGTEWRTPVHEP